MQYLVIVFKSAMLLLESYAAQPEVQNNHPFLVIVVLGGKEISVTRVGLLSSLVYA